MSKLPRTSVSVVGKSTRVRFTYNDDLAFLKEFLAHNPMQNENGWKVIQRNLELITSKKFAIRTLKHHFLQLLMEIWLEKDEIEKLEYDSILKRKRPISKEKQISELGKKAGNKHTSIFLNTNGEEHENESENESNHESATSIFELEDHNYMNSQAISLNILEEVEVSNNDDDVEIVLLGDKNTNSGSGSTPSNNKAKGNKISLPKRTPQSGSNILGTARKRLNKKDPIRKNAPLYLSGKSQKENELKRKELELEERKLAIEERRLDLADRKYELDKQRLEIKSKERLQKIE
ncbi:unnamed protein product [Phaedon cochleariae]|uniref:Uncharacterized protein n=1 Tax=Phaedon cochleariae TaxID=80249 RepID=A0A9N9SL17_PHACE|nr:unnamed protein product [Phaedon cochleariae]